MVYLLQQLLRKSAQRYPDKDAVVSGDRSITFLELDTLSTRLANSLARGSIKRGDRVGIHLNKSIESVVAIFGILKSGATYVPLDPAAPVKRVAFIIGNCGMRGLVTSPEKAAPVAGALGDASPIACVVLTDEASEKGKGLFNGASHVSWEEMSRTPATPPAPAGEIEDDLAYILYTSGSTGEPKGVMISHRASLTFINWACDTFRVRHTDRLSNHAPLHFDLSIFDIFTAIKAGATVVLIPDELSVFPMNLADFIAKQRITVWYSVPSVLTRLVLYGGLERCSFPDLRTVLFAGEVFPTKYLRQFKNLVPHPEYYNLYGPTETNVCTYYQVGDIPAEQVEPIPIGKACNNTEVFAVNEMNEVAGPGEVGELYVRGPSLMKGYWGLPERTQQVLVSNRVQNPLFHEMAYQTGDLVKLADDGNYIFLGRNDNMIKSRGYRIELGEIETALYSHPEVEEAAVVAIPDEEIGNIIKAIVVTRNGQGMTRGKLEAYCAQRIPKYMVPGVIEFRASLPKTSTGKVDKKAFVNEHLEAQMAKVN